MIKIYYIIESEKKNKNGHVSHLMRKDLDGTLFEVSVKTGKEIRNWHCYWTLEEYLKNGWKLVDPKDAVFTGGWRRPFLDYLIENELV